MGAHFALRLVEGAAGELTLASLQVPLWPPARTPAQPLHEAALPWPCAWVLGHEGQGVSPALMARCALQLRIPQPGGEESLNVAAAAAVCLYESARSASRHSLRPLAVGQYISRSGRRSRRIVVAISSIDLCVDDSQAMPSRRIIASASLTS